MTWGCRGRIVLSPTKAAPFTYGVTAMVLGFGLGLQPAQAEPCIVDTYRIAMVEGVCIVAPGTELRAGALATAVSATNLGTVIDLRPGATITTSTTRRAID